MSAANRTLLDGFVGPAEPRTEVAGLAFVTGYAVARVAYLLVGAMMPGWAAWVGAGLGLAAGGTLVARAMPRVRHDDDTLHEGQIAGAVISPGRERPSRRGGLEVLEAADVAWSWPTFAEVLPRVPGLHTDALRGPVRVDRVFQQPRVTLLDLVTPLRLPDGRWLEEHVQLRRPTGRSSPRPDEAVFVGDPDQWSVASVTTRPTTAAALAAALRQAPAPGPPDPQVSSQVRAIRARHPEWEPSELTRLAEVAWGEAVEALAGGPGPSHATETWATAVVFLAALAADSDLQPRGGQVVRRVLSRVTRDGWNELTDVDLVLDEGVVRVRLLHPSGGHLGLDGWRVWSVQGLWRRVS